MELPDTKVQKFMELLRTFAHRKRCTLRQLQQLAGKLNWASQVVFRGRVFLRRILNMMQHVKQANHKVRLDHGFRLDVQWWLQNMQAFNRKQLAFSSLHSVDLDASNVAGGYYYRELGDWGHTSWAQDAPAIQDMHINNKEIFAGVLAARRWGHLWTDSVVVFYTDNITARAAFHKGTAKSEEAMIMLRELFWIQSLYNFEIVSVHVPGFAHIMPDTISRLRQPGFLPWLAAQLGFIYPECNFMHFVESLQHHMTYDAFLSLQGQIRKYCNIWIN